MGNEKWFHLDECIILDIERRLKKNSKVTVKVTINKVRSYEVIKDLDEDFIKYDLRTLSIYKDTIIDYNKKELKILYSDGHVHSYTFKF